MAMATATVRGHCHGVVRRPQPVAVGRGIPQPAHRQSAAVAASAHATDDQAFIDALSLDED